MPGTSGGRNGEWLQIDMECFFCSDESVLEYSGDACIILWMPKAAESSTFKKGIISPIKDLKNAITTFPSLLTFYSKVIASVQ